MDKYDIESSIHHGDAFDVYDVGAGAVAIVRRVDGVERLLEPKDGEMLVHALDMLGYTFVDTAEYVVEADRQLSEYFAD